MVVAPAPEKVQQRQDSRSDVSTETGIQVTQDVPLIRTKETNKSERGRGEDLPFGGIRDVHRYAVNLRRVPSLQKGGTIASDDGQAARPIRRLQKKATSLPSPSPLVEVAILLSL